MFMYIVLANLWPFRAFSRAALDTPVHPCPAPFYQSKEFFLFVMYIINEQVISGQLVPAPIT